MYKDYHKAIISSATTLYGRGGKTHFLPKEIVELRQKEMMAHNLYRLHEQQGNAQEAAGAKQHRNYLNQEYREQKKKFFTLSTEQNRLE